MPNAKNMETQNAKNREKFIKLQKSVKCKKQCFLQNGKYREKSDVKCKNGETQNAENMETQNRKNSTEI